MEYIKEFCLENKIGVVRTMTYGDNLDFLNRLYREAKRSYPHLTPEHCTVKYYGGRHYARTYGIEFYAGEQREGYETIKQLEYTK